MTILLLLLQCFMLYFFAATLVFDVAAITIIAVIVVSVDVVVVFVIAANAYDFKTNSGNSAAA